MERIGDQVRIIGKQNKTNRKTTQGSSAPDEIVWTCSCKNHEVILGSGVGEKDDVRNALDERPGSFVWLG